MNEEVKLTCPYGNESVEEHPCPFDVTLDDADASWCICCKECQLDCFKEAAY